ncbi:CueP family metal-binding protein [Paenibacillus sp. CMAA1364]
MKKKVWLASGLVIVALSTYIIVGGMDREESNNQSVQDIKQLVSEYSASKMDHVSASITSQQLIVNDVNKQSITYDLPDDEFFVSIAPYIEVTHPCDIHSLTGCQGEMIAEEFNVHITDMEGKVIMDQSMKSQTNGFIDLWLARDQTYQITIQQDGLTATSKISTFDNDNTCITDMQLLAQKAG